MNWLAASHIIWYKCFPDTVDPRDRTLLKELFITAFSALALTAAGRAAYSQRRTDAL